jgi:hypothetical protein
VGIVLIAGRNAVNMAVSGLTPWLSQKATSSATQRTMADGPIITGFDRNGNVVTEFDLIGTPCGDHLTEHGDVIDNAPAVIEDDFGLRLIHG